MHVYYKFGLLLIFLLSVSTSQTHAAPSKQQNNSADFSYDYADDDYDENQSTEQAAYDLLHTTTTSTYRPIFSIPRRSSQVLEPSCPRACICMQDFKYVQCANAHLTHVPLDMPKMAAIIDLSHNAIAELRAEDFANLSKVVEINLNYNLISQLDKEAFYGLERLRRLQLANNRLSKIEPDTFAGAADLALLDLSNNTIMQREVGSFLDQPGLNEFSCNNCSWTHLPEQTFFNMSALDTLRLAHNDFKKQINIRAFTPLKRLIKLKLPELERTNIEELCNLLKSIDNISFKHFDISCFELVLGTSFNDSLIFATDPPFKRITDLPTTANTTAAPTRAANRSKLNKMSYNITTALPTLNKAGILHEDKAAGTTADKEEPYQVPISQQTINTLLICIMVIAIIGLMIGLICRKDIGGIKTKCCRTSKPEPKDQVHPTEEIPLNKLA